MSWVIMATEVSAGGLVLLLFSPFLSVFLIHLIGRCNADICVKFFLSCHFFMRIRTSGPSVMRRFCRRRPCTDWSGYCKLISFSVSLDLFEIYASI